MVARLDQERDETARERSTQDIKNQLQEEIGAVKTSFYGNGVTNIIEMIT